MIRTNATVCFATLMLELPLVLSSTASFSATDTARRCRDHRAFGSESPPAVERTSETPVSSSVHAHATKGETRDPLSGTYGNNASVCNSDEENGSSSANSTASAAGAFGAAPPAVEDISRQAQILQELSRKVINMGELRRLASQGIPDGAGIRATVWKLLLGYLPADRSLWPSELAKKRSQYKSFKEELLMNPIHIEQKACQSEITRRLEKSSLENHELDDGSQGFLSRSEISHGEHPLSLGKSSIWNQFFQETEIMEQIDRDVMRTHPDIHFFSGDSTFAKSNQEALRNILIVFAKLNPGIRYVQGMNEILAPLFYIFKNDPNEENAAFAEADTFFCFVELLSGFRDNFVQQLDNSVVGIRATITRLSMLLKEHDEELWRHLEMTTKVNPQFYAFRWITLLLTQEFNFADSLIIWDTLMSDPDGPQETLLRVCCAMLVIVRKRLLAGDFTSNLKLLQNYPPTNISHLLYVANKMRLR
ncbi:hypothetical protein DH2020_005117 [Rehmannia glutinosa]|uniref:Rab-GAP TBC domain-containing protein n=1 Tax=Rehmannia glutinosa TaxID=99300 RepID=A0ABR0XRC9_REHGL